MAHKQHNDLSCQSTSHRLEAINMNLQCKPVANLMGCCKAVYLEAIYGRFAQLL